MRKYFSTPRQKGFSVVEIAIGVSIAALTITFMSHAVVRYASQGSETLERTRAIFLAEEGVELMRYLHDDSWTNLSSLTNGTKYYLSLSTTTVATTTSATLIDGVFTRAITTSAVYRATSGDDIVASTSGVAKAVDVNTKLVTVTVTWGSATSSASLSEYLANY